MSNSGFGNLKLLIDTYWSIKTDNNICQGMPLIYIGLKTFDCEYIYMVCFY